MEGKRFVLRHVRSEENTSDVNSKNTKIEIHTKMADCLYNGLIVAEVELEEENKKGESSKEDVEYSPARTVDDSGSGNPDQCMNNDRGNENLDQVNTAISREADGQDSEYSNDQNQDQGRQGNRQGTQQGTIQGDSIIEETQRVGVTLDRSSSKGMRESASESTSKRRSRKTKKKR